MSKDIILENPTGLIDGDIIVDDNPISADITVDHNIIDGDITVDDNTVETPIIPERPNVVKHEQFELFAPLANYRHAGMASFDPNSFIVENGRVKNRTNLAKAITDFVIDQSGKTISLHFNDGSVKTTVIPDADFDRVTNALTLITISEDSWIEDVDGEEVYYYFVATSEVTGRNDSNYFVSLEVSDNAYDPTIGMVKSGHFVMNESCFKASDGSLLICSNAPFIGRVLVMTSIFTNELLRNEKVADTEEGTIYNQVFKDGTTVQWLAPKGPEGTIIVCEEILRPAVNNIAVGYEGTVKASSISGVANVGDKMSAFIVTTAGFTYGAVIEITSDENNGVHAYVVKDLTFLHSDVDDGNGTLVSKYAITINKTYDTILERINNGLAVDALKPWVFNRVPMVNEQVFSVCTTIDGQTIGCTLEILGVNDSGNYPFKIVNLVVLYRAPLILLYTLWPNTTADEILNGYDDSAPLSTFNRTPYIGEVFSAMIKTSSGDAMTMTARISGYSEKDGVTYAKFYSIESTLLANDATTLTRTMRFGGVTPKIFTDVNDEGEYTFVGTRGHHAIGVELFTVTPRVGSVFFGTVVLKNNNSDNYSSIATFTAEVTAINTNDRNSVVEYKLIDATIFHDGDVDDKVNNLGDDVNNVVNYVNTEVPGLKNDIKNTLTNANNYTDQKVNETAFTINGRIDETELDIMELNERADMLSSGYEDILKVAQGAQKSIVFNNYWEMRNDDRIASGTLGSLNIGQNIYIKTVGVPDLWVYEFNEGGDEPDWTEDTIDTVLVEKLNEIGKDGKPIGKVQVGRWLLAQLETGKVFSGDYASKEDVAKAKQEAITASQVKIVRLI